eukprot:PhF_6_TR20685/c0_g1_i1/m.29762/K03019/RPC11, POLR3K; DNA-directed RNA polymerase III subunit RPC11
MLFCPYCGTQLLVEKVGSVRFYCTTCPYAQPLTFVREVPEHKTLKKVDDVLGGPDAWKHADKTDAKCPDPECPGERAYFKQIQIRSGDEPMTTFYRCCECGEMWRQD